MKRKTIFFDVYQTLLSVDFKKNAKAWDVFSSFLSSRGVPADTFRFQEMFDQEKQNYYHLAGDFEMKFRHHNLFDLIDTVLRKHGIGAGKKELSDLIWKFRQIHSPDVKLYPGVEEILDELYQKYILAIASYAQGSYLPRELEKLGIAKYFSHFIISSDIGYRKTDPEFYKICLKKTQQKPAECLMIGDNYLQDVAMPKKAGIKAVLIRNPLTDKQNIIGNTKPDSIVKIEDMATLSSVIQSILSPFAEDRERLSSGEAGKLAS
ncbi:MAG: HAD family hydrolase [Parcubacteria group bacterium]|jgi:putative hydrolase of the HAD superfamily